MKNSELKEYLNMFPDDEEVVILLANPRERKIYEVEQIEPIADAGCPELGIIVGQASDMDAEMVEVCEEYEREVQQLYGQMNITDFPEVLP